MEFEEYARQRLPDLVRFTTAVCADRALAEDVVQEVLLRVHSRWSEIQELDAPEMYIRRSLVNEYLSWRRKWARLVPHAVVPRRDAASPDHATELADRSMLVTELAALPPRQRAVLVMRFYGGLADNQIADVLGCRTATVRGYAARALTTLRIELTEQSDTAARSERAH
ncbi:MAG: SigE family RNA polymerase sigma factor [Pseudonocardiales bacterium]|nr:MAG: SigE family RNA polymerase sigma factor [Pseudonocardiales bacterium]